MKNDPFHQKRVIITTMVMIFYCPYCQCKIEAPIKFLAHFPGDTLTQRYKEVIDQHWGRCEYSPGYTKI